MLIATVGVAEWSKAAKNFTVLTEKRPKKPFLGICSKNIGGFFKITGNIGDFYENIGEFHQFQKSRRNWPFLQEIQEVVPGLVLLSGQLINYKLHNSASINKQLKQ